MLKKEGTLLFWKALRTMEYALALKDINDPNVNIHPDLEKLINKHLGHFLEEANKKKLLPYGKGPRKNYGVDLDLLHFAAKIHKGLTECYREFIADPEMKATQLEAKIKEMLSNEQQFLLDTFFPSDFKFETQCLTTRDEITELDGPYMAAIETLCDVFKTIGKTRNFQNYLKDIDLYQLPKDLQDRLDLIIAKKLIGQNQPTFLESEAIVSEVSSLEDI